jgi:formimidoylglutamate deiminase
MKYLQFDSILSDGRWITPGFVEIDQNGYITKLADSPSKGRPVEYIPGWAIPGFCNGHSHAFQYAMAGMTEYLPQAAVHDDFWSWRETMYQVALTMEPDDVEKTAAMVYGEMLRLGYTSVVEFQYLHHDTQGKPYQNSAEISIRLVAAAQKAGIRLILVPVFYQLGDFESPPQERQRRFVFKDVDQYFNLLETCKKELASYPDISLGLGIHSLRAVPPELAQKVFSYPLIGPRHMHLAEQQKEVNTCKTVLGVSPTQWVLDHLDLNENYYFTHTTHATPAEVKELARRKAHVVLCPSTEGNLGDGFFPLIDFLKGESPQRGGFLLGSDSHVGLNPLEELRWLDYIQRLRLEKRNPLCHQDGDESSNILFSALARAREHSGDPNQLRVGDLLDCLVIDKDHPIFAGKKMERLLSVLVYCADPSVFKAVLRRGQFLVKEGRHRMGDTLVKDYLLIQKKLQNKINLIF